MDRYPEISASYNPKDLIIEPANILDALKLGYDTLAVEQPEIYEITDRLCLYQNLPDLIQLTDIINTKLPMQNDAGELHPLLTTRSQIESMVNNKLSGVGDCKLLTIMTAYITSGICRLPTLTSIRCYSGHPILYVELQEQPYKVSYLHEKPRISPVADLDMFELRREQVYDTNFIEEDFPNDKSILYWNVRDAIFVLDCMNIMRRSVVNYAIDPTYYATTFTEAANILNDSSIPARPVLNYWENELDRITSMYNDPRAPQDPQIFKKRVANSLRF